MSDFASRMAAAYATDGPAIELGRAMQAGTIHPDAVVQVPAAMCNRHGLIAGATGTGKTKTLQLMAEQLSALGVPVFAADIKGDLSGLSRAGQASDAVTRRAGQLGIDWTPSGFPVTFLSLGGLGPGVPVRATISEFGPQLLAKVMDANETQASSLSLVFRYADENSLALLDLADLREVLRFLDSDEGKDELKAIGGLSSATTGVLLRKIVELEDQGGEAFFGEPELEVADLLRTTPEGQGVISCLELAPVQDRPRMFSTFLMWLLAELFHDLPEVGDLDKPKLVFFFDEAHLLFADATDAFLDQVTQTVRLIRSKGVGVFFVTQLPDDVPDAILAQLGNRVQHALRAFTPEDQTALAKTVKTYPTTEHYDMEEALTSLGTGEAIVTVLSERGAPTPVAWARMRAPRSLMAAIGPDAVAAAAKGSPLFAKYGETVDRESAYEKLTARIAEPPVPAPADAPPPPPPPPAERAEPSFVEKAFESPVVRSFLRSAASALGREITRGLFGTRTRRRR